MGGIAALAKAAGHKVTGCDANVYPPMSTQLTDLGIDIIEGYDPGQLDSGAGLRRRRQCDESAAIRSSKSMLDRRIALLLGPAMAGRARVLHQSSCPGCFGHPR